MLLKLIFIGGIFVFFSCTPKNQYKDIEIYFKNSIEFLKQGYIDRAIDQIKNAEKETSKFPPALYFLGSMHHLNNETKDARLKYLSAINLFQDYLMAHFNLGILCLSEQDYICAKEHLYNALNLYTKKNQKELLYKNFIYTNEKTIEKQYSIPFLINFKL
jgi:chemotaxis protein methyltransferase CheR